MEDFTKEDPGRGEPGALDELTGQLRQDQDKLEHAHGGVRKSADTIREHWHGKTGQAAAVTHDVLLTSIVNKHQAIDRVVAACQGYRDTHEDVKDRARVWVLQLEQARQTIGTATSLVKGPQNAPGMAELIESATRSKTAALLEEKEALERLAALYEERVEARATFQSAITDITDETHGAGITARAIADRPRSSKPKPNNTSPWELGQQWLTGSGPRHQEFTDNDPFTKLLREHSHVMDVRDNLRALLDRGRLPVGPATADYSYHLGGGDGAAKYVADYSTLATGGATGNLAVTFLGSYKLQPNVISLNADGSATVRFVVTNTSDIQSATHPPVIGYTDWWRQIIGDPLDSVFSHLGPMSPTTQTITWTETIRP
ncbi:MULTISPECIES: hypothetical protein [unclassified Leifsonia]|uniref:hypothetical protein n=1 Tax=unclassified Leifsonia TaxID=2663824 RepID=UPI0008A7F6C1|nr:MULTISPECIES: hypothetical protein [unclassified Leifsonia]SEH78339.1 hypothetical protein SAMN04515694_10432 [Leifsonia sp. CL154]SFL40450.1 hypothetical protein SAMN04515692_10431 [Leifsonia sp. CL147]